MTQVYLALGATDMRKSINTLAVIVEGKLRLNLFSGHMFAFCNRRRDIIKVLYWDRNGFCLWLKRLEKDRYRWPESEEEVMELSRNELKWLVDGMEISSYRQHRRLNYSSVI
jgi:transposase